jgi:hypothetical protein
MRHPPVSSLGGELHDRTVTRYRHYSRDAELSGFLYGKIHAVSARYALRELHGKRGFALYRPPGNEAGAHSVSGYPSQFGDELATIAIEHRDGLAAV